MAISLILTGNSFNSEMNQCAFEYFAKIKGGLFLWKELNPFFFFHGIDFDPMYPWLKSEVEKHNLDLGRTGFTHAFTDEIDQSHVRKYFWQNGFVPADKDGVNASIAFAPEYSASKRNDLPSGVEFFFVLVGDSVSSSKNDIEKIGSAESLLLQDDRVGIVMNEKDFTPFRSAWFRFKLDPHDAYYRKDPTNRKSVVSPLLNIIRQAKSLGKHLIIPFALRLFCPYF